MEIDGKVCRICLDAETNLLSLDVKLEDQFQGRKMLEFLLGTEVHVHENFSGICESCMKNLRVSYTFKQKCSESEMKIREYIFANNTKKVEFVDVKDCRKYDPLPFGDTLETLSVHIKEDDDSNFDESFDIQESPCLQEEIAGNTERYKRRVKSATLKIIKDVDEDNNDEEIPLEENKKITCRKCNITFPSMKTYSLHYRTEHKKKKTERIDCEDCGKSVVRENYKKHRKTHLGETFSCSQCSTSFSTKANLRYHMLLHTNEKNYVCHYCNEAFSIYRHRKEHILKYHEPPEKKFACKICPKKFTKRYDLTCHVRRHQGDAGEPQHACKLCPKKFSRSTGLKEHMTEHTGEKNFICPVCGKAFARARVLTVHMCTHKEERDFVCEICKKGFTQCQVLRAHYSKAHPDVPPPPRGTILKRNSVAKIAEAEREKIFNEAKKGSNLNKSK